MTTTVIEEGKQAFYSSLTAREQDITCILEQITTDIKERYGHDIVLKYQRVETLRVDYSRETSESSQSLEETVSVGIVTAEDSQQLIAAGRIERAATDVLTKDAIEAMVISCLENTAKVDYGTTEPILLASSVPNVRTYSIKPEIDPNSLSFGDKITKLEHILAHTDVTQEGITFKGNILYREVTDTRIIIGSNGTLVKDVRPLPEIRVSITSDKDGQGKKTRHDLWKGVGGLEVALENKTLYDGIETIKGRLRESYEEISFADYCAQRGLIQSAVLQNSNFVLAPIFFAVVLHEAIGHPVSEAELIMIGDSVVSDNGKLNPMQVAVPGFHAAFDSGGFLCHGYRAVDDEGTHVEKIYVIKDGKIGNGTELLHSRHTAATLGGTPKGTCVSEKGWQTPVPRQSVMRWEIDESKIPCYGSTEKEMTIEEFYKITEKDPDRFFGKDHAKTLFFIDRTGGGAVSTATGEFALNSRDTYVIRYGEAPVRVKPFTFKGNSTEFLKDNIEYVIACKLDPFKGMCGKYGQNNPSVTFGEYAIVIRYDPKKMVISGDK